ncbi:MULTISPECIES: oligosaccharide flippase family protein [Flavobacterium]|uniref:Oligosaccharide flippase family protein n=1 Tax=Flavobacterium keumense TaxID=1306518 RepID=A0ABY8N2N0_9FLAO|nr:MULTISPECIES: oligosaccharide flippase family protein [Flavobacterium]WGK93576.1 oligosaccharide flippase family protein [Flavobacterium keumense]
MSKFIIDYLNDKKQKQTLILLITSILVMILVLGINYFITRILEKNSFGNYSLVLNIFNFSQIVFNFGLFYSISRGIAIVDDNSRHRELYGAGLIISFCLFIIMILCLIVFFLIFDKSTTQEVINSLLFCIPFSWIFLLNNFNELLLQGGNRILLLSFSRFMPKFFFLILLIVIYSFTSHKISTNTILCCFIVSSIIPYFIIIHKLKPKLTNFKKRIQEIKVANNKFGFNVYVGSLFAVGSSSLSGVLIGYFGINNIEVGYYAIALQLSAPLSLIPNVIATTSFKKFANSQKIDKTTLTRMYVISFTLVILIFIIAKPIILMIYGDEYIECVYLLYYLSIGSLLYGIADFFNRFLLAKGKGKELRNSSFIVGGVLIISNFILINISGAKGAALATIISGLTYFFIIVFYYKKVSNFD